MAGIASRMLIQVNDGVRPTASTASHSTQMPRMENAIRPGRLSSMNGYSKTAASWTKRSTADGVSFAFCTQRMR